MKKNLFIVLTLSAVLIVAVACSGSNPLDPSGQNVMPDAPTGGDFSGVYCIHFEATAACGWEGDIYINVVQEETVITVTLFTDDTGLAPEINCANALGDPPGTPILTGIVDPLTGDFSASGSEDLMHQWWGCGTDSTPPVMAGNLFDISGTLDDFQDSCACSGTIFWSSNTVGYKWCTVGSSGCAA